MFDNTSKSKKEFRISAYVEWPDSMEITFDVLQDCVRSIYEADSRHQ